MLFTLKVRLPLVSEGLQGFFTVFGLQQWLICGSFEVQAYKKLSSVIEM
jgi:hypothetical protein